MHQNLKYIRETAYTERNEPESPKEEKEAATYISPCQGHMGI
jgi:hypothetical protein